MSKIDEEDPNKTPNSQAGSQLENDSDLDRISASTEGIRGQRMQAINADLKHTQEPKIEITDPDGNPITKDDDDS